MTDWSPLGRLRTMQAEIAATGGAAFVTMTVHGWGRCQGLTWQEFAELLDDAELGKAMRGVETILGRRNASTEPGQ